MCLMILSSEVEAEFKTTKHGWKVFVYNESSGDLFSSVFTDGHPKPINEWINADDYRDRLPYDNNASLFCEDSTSISYPNGWHIYLDEYDAVEAAHDNYPQVCRRVEFDEPVAWGYQDYDEFDESYEVPVVVAKKIKIIE